MNVRDAGALCETVQNAAIGSAACRALKGGADNPTCAVENARGQHVRQLRLGDLRQGRVKTPLNATQIDPACQ